MINKLKCKSRLGKSSRKIFQLIWGMLMISVCGCVPAEKREVLPPPIGREAVLDLYQARLENIDAFQAKVVHWSARFYDQDIEKYRQFNEMGGKVFYRPGATIAEPACLYLSLNSLAGESLVIGSNAQEYWLHVPVEKIGWWGRHEYVGRDCADEIPISPTDLLTMLGLRDPAMDDARSAQILYRVEGAHYIISHVNTAQGQWFIAKDILLDRRTLLPAAIRIYDKEGQVVKESYLQEYQRVGRAWLPKRIELISPLSDEYIRLQLGDPKEDLSSRERRRELLYDRQTHTDGLQSYYQLDRNCRAWK